MNNRLDKVLFEFNFTSYDLVENGGTFTLKEPRSRWLFPRLFLLFAAALLTMESARLRYKWGLDADTSGWVCVTLALVLVVFLVLLWRYPRRSWTFDSAHRTIRQGTEVIALDEEAFLTIRMTGILLHQVLLKRPIQPDVVLVSHGERKHVEALADSLASRIALRVNREG